jgi:opacity protein-like surface antigen
MKAIAAAALAGIAMASTPSLAADLFGTAAPPMSFPAENGPTAEVGSNWYIRGDIGAGLDTVPAVTFSTISIPPQGDASTPLSGNSGASQLSRNFLADVAIFVGGVGYRFNNYFRVDATYEYRNGPGGTSTTTVVCPYSANGVFDQLNTTIEYGYLYNTSNTCDGDLELKQHNNMVLGNAYVDLGTYWGITPYVGAAAGVNVTSTSGSLAFFETANGQPYAANLTPTGTYPQQWVTLAGTPLSPQPNIAFTNQNWNRTIQSTKYSFALALMAGFGVALTPSATLDIGYRYLNTGASTLYISNPLGASLKNSNVSQEIRIGIRYMAD